MSQNAAGNALPLSSVIFSGGYGKRLRSISKGRPKCLVPVYRDICILDLVIVQLLEFGVTEFLLAPGVNLVPVREHLIKHWRWLHYSFLFERQVGTAEVLRENLERLPSRILLANGDTVLLRYSLDSAYKACSVLDRFSTMGIGRSWGSSLGNVRLGAGIILEYDKAGVTSRLSDCGYQILNLRDSAACIEKSRGMLEDGFMGSFFAKEKGPWLHADPYIDLGSELTMNAARNEILENSDTIDRTHGRMNKIAKVLLILRSEQFVLKGLHEL